MPPMPPMGPGEGCRNEWCEPVSDEDYAKLG